MNGEGWSATEVKRKGRGLLDIISLYAVAHLSQAGSLNSGDHDMSIVHLADNEKQLTSIDKSFLRDPQTSCLRWIHTQSDAPRSIAESNSPPIIF